MGVIHAAQEHIELFLSDLAEELPQLLDDLISEGFSLFVRQSGRRVVLSLVGQCDLE